MIPRKFNHRPAVLLLLLVALLGYACTRVEDRTRSSSLLVVDAIEAESGDGETGVPLLSDVCDNENTEPQDPDLCTVFNDNAIVSFTNELLQVGPGVPGVPDSSFLNDIIVDRYRVEYFRPNDRNTPGIDVPFSIDGTMHLRIPAGGSAESSIIVVRHEAKREPPLDELAIGTSEGVMTVNAKLTFFGTDISGRGVTATGFLEIHFANYGEE